MRLTNWGLVYITGGSSGIGYAIASRVLQENGSVVLFARNRHRLEQAAERLSASFSAERISVIVMDVTSYESIQGAVDEAVTSRGAPDMLVNCAGMAHPDHFFHLSYDIFAQTIETNLLGTAAVTKLVLPHMSAGSHLVMISSIAGFLGTYGYTAYSASKFGIMGFSQALRNELRPEGISVSVLCPPDTDTPQLVEENKTKPPETFAISGNAKLMSSLQVAKAFAKGVKKGQFLIIPGTSGKMIFLLNQLVPGLVRTIMDGIVRKARKQEGLTRRFVFEKGDQAPE